MLRCFKPAHIAQDLAVVELLCDHGATQSAQAELMQYVKQHGSTIMAYSTLQQGLSYFLIRGVGYIAYGMRHIGPSFLHLRSPVALGDPVCHPKDRAKLAAAFLQRYHDALFMQASRQDTLCVCIWSSLESKICCGPIHLLELAGSAW